ncbi:MAG: DUF6095 family protein [Schleiferiaceae bacterium]|nr:DUF6095 family protein [Schleiferiaceae bacterium]
MSKSDQDHIVAGLLKLAWSFPFIFAGPALFIGKGTSGAWYWTVLSLILMLSGICLITLGLRQILRGFFGD